MIEIKQFDIDAGWEDDITFEPHEIVAFQLMGIKADDIAGMCPTLFDKKPDFDKKRWKALFPQAKGLLQKLWNNYTLDRLKQLVRENKSQYFVVTSATVASLFQKAGAIPVPNNMVTYLLGVNITPDLSSCRFMFPEQPLANLSAWKSLFLLPSMEIYDKVRHDLWKSDDVSIKNRKEAAGTIIDLIDYIGEEQVYDPFPQWKEKCRNALSYLPEAGDLTEHEAQLCYHYAPYYLSNFKTIKLRDIPSRFLNTYTDAHGVIFSDGGKRLIGVEREKRSTLSNYAIPTGIESLDSDAFSDIKSLEGITLNDGLRRIGANMFHGCSSLKSLVIPASVDFLIGGGLCEHCTSLKEVRFEGHQEYLDIADFNGCLSLEQMKLPKGLTGLSDNVFSGTDSLKSIDISNVRWIGGECFVGTGLQQIILGKHIENVAQDAFIGLGNDVVRIECAPTFYKFPLEFDIDFHDFPDLFQDFWLKDLLFLYAFIRNANDNNERRYELGTIATELKRYIDWIRRSWYFDLDEDFIEDCFATMAVKGFSPLYFLCVICHEFTKHDMMIHKKDAIKYALGFKKFLPTLYSLIGESATYSDIEKAVDSINSESDISEPINDEMLAEELNLALNQYSFNGRTIVRMRDKFGFLPGIGKTLTVETGVLMEFKKLLHSGNKD